jgi:hypothetical protein
VLRSLSIVLGLVLSLAAQEVYYYQAKERIAYKQTVKAELLKQVSQEEMQAFQLEQPRKYKHILKRCEKFNSAILSKKNYTASHIINKGTFVCKDDMDQTQKNKIIFNINGLFEIEREGQLIRETEEYIKFRNSDGKVETIYKR